MNEEKIYEKAYKLYEKFGASAVYDYANELGLDYNYCEPCEAETPTIEECICLVCGSEQKKTLTN